jgi:hypothetical protein
MTAHIVVVIFASGLLLVNTRIDTGYALCKDNQLMDGDQELQGNLNV